MVLSPVLTIFFFIPALNLSGIPPFSGFIGKVALFLAASTIMHGCRRSSSSPAP
jgi:formate hydrogenlyase subunit 3/multisubunit Na+/H+ antiporter MnhD subunit